MKVPFLVQEDHTSHRTKTLIPTVKTVIQRSSHQRTSRDSEGGIPPLFPRPPPNQSKQAQMRSLKVWNKTWYEPASKGQGTSRNPQGQPQDHQMQDCSHYTGPRVARSGPIQAQNQWDGFGFVPSPVASAILTDSSQNTPSHCLKLQDLFFPSRNLIQKYGFWNRARCPPDKRPTEVYELVGGAGSIDLIIR
jgi:hypothetical protein